jgi:zinc transport system permease protein
MFEQILEMLSYPFMIRAFAAGLAVALAASLLGVSLVLKRYSMIGDGLSHVSFGCLAIAAALNWAPLAVTLPVVSASAFLLLRLNESKRIAGDAAIALIACASLAAGIIVITFTTGMNVDVYNYMFGSVLSVTRGDVALSASVSGVVIVLFILFFHRIFAVTFDESFARATGLNAGLYNSFFALLTAITIVVGMRLTGALLISSLIIFPPLTAMRLCKTFRSVAVVSATVSACSFLIGLTMSYLLGTPAGASIVGVNTLVFVLFYAAGKLRTLVAKTRKQP